MSRRPPSPPVPFDDEATSHRIGTLALAFCVGSAAALMAMHATKARAQPAGPADGAPLMRAPLQVVASNGGADWEPGWWLNLRAGSAGHVEVDGTVTPVTAAEITGDEREAMWKRLNAEVFDYDSYQAKVSRRLAVVALTPVR